MHYIIVCFRIPTIDGTDNGTLWPPLNATEETFLHINSVKPQIIKNPLMDMHKFWSELPLNSRLKKFASTKKSNTKMNANDDAYLFNLNMSTL